MSDWSPSKWFAQQFPNLQVEWPQEDPWVVNELRLLAESGPVDGIKYEGTPVEEWLARFPLDRLH